MTVESLPLEIIHPDHPRGSFRFALFDFDGTLSLIREGWQGVMIPLMVELLLDTHSGETTAELETIVREFVGRLTGKQTIYQAMQLAEEIEKRGGKAADPLHYKWLYLERLQEHICHRLEGLRTGTISPQAMMVPGAEEILQALRARGVTLFLASGTDHQFVCDECDALGLSSYFNGGIYGALDDYQSFSKKILIARLLRDHALHGSELVTFGDGFVEIENTKEANGVAVGVASDEVHREGIDAWKRHRLIEAGADIIIPHFRQYQTLVAYLFREEPC